jgi:drug/metabolite transporter (DMT)-like permease
VLITVVLGLTAALCWGAPDVPLAQAVRRLDPLRVLVGSLLLGTLAVLPAALFLEPPSPTPRAVALAALLGVLTVVGFLYGFAAFRDGAVSVAAPIISCEGAVAAALAIAAGERPSPFVILLLGLAAAGVVLVALGEGGGGGGALPATVAALIWGGILALSAPLAHDVGAYWAFLGVRLVAVVVVLAIALPRHAATAWTTEPWRVAAWGVGDAAAYLSFVAAADRGPAAVAGVLAAQFATVGALMGVALLGERLTRRQVFGVVLVIGSVSGLAVAAG